MQNNGTILGIPEFVKQQHYYALAKGFPNSSWETYKRVSTGEKKFPGFQTGFLLEEMKIPQLFKWH